MNVGVKTTIVLHKVRMYGVYAISLLQGQLKLSVFSPEPCACPLCESVVVFRLRFVLQLSSRRYYKVRTCTIK